MPSSISEGQQWKERSISLYLCELLLSSIEEWKDSRHAKRVQLCGEAFVADWTPQNMYGTLTVSPDQGLTYSALLEAQLCGQLRGLSKHSGLRVHRRVPIIKTQVAAVLLIQDVSCTGEEEVPRH